MTKSEYKKYISSEDWQKRRKVWLLENNWCTNCHMPRWISILAYDQDLHVHHTRYDHIGSETFVDLATLCPRCHDIETFSRSDRREIKGRACPLCTGMAYDNYSDCCPTCASIRGGLPDALLNANETRGHQPVWKQLLVDIAHSAGMENVEKFVKEISASGFFR